MSDNLGSDILIKRILLVAVLFGGSILLAFYSIAHGNLAFGFAFPILLAVAYFFRRPTILYIYALAASAMVLKFPGLPAAIGVPVLFQLLLILWAFIDRALQHGATGHSHIKKVNALVLLFGMNLLSLMIIHGSGFARLGGYVLGGTYYLGSFITIAFYFASLRLHFSSRDVKTLIWSLLIAASVPAIIQVGSTYAPGVFDWMTRYVNTRALENVSEDGFSSENTIQRWSGLTSLAYAIIPVTYILIRKKWIQYTLIIAAFALIGMAGFRSRIIQVSAIALACSVYFSQNRIYALMKWSILGAVTLALLFVFATYLPRPVQRAVCFVPGLPVQPDIAANAKSSSNMRFEMWREYCIPNVPKHLLIGRGFAHDIRQYAWLQRQWYGSLEFFYYMGSYHSGPFSLLLDHGILGTTAFTIFFVLVTADAWRILQKHARHPSTIYAKYYAYLTILMTWKVIEYYFIFGDVKTSLFSMLTVAAQLHIMKKGILIDLKPDSDVQAAVGAIGVCRGQA